MYEGPRETCYTKRYCCIWDHNLVAFLGPGFVTIRVAHWSSPNNILADKEKLFFSVFLLCSVL